MNLPAVKPDVDTLPARVADMQSACAFLREMARILKARTALAEMQRQIDGLEARYYQEVGAYYRERTDGKGTQLHLGTFEDWCRARIFANKGKAKYTDLADPDTGEVLGRGSLRAAPKKVEVLDLDDLRAWALETGNTHLCPLKPVADLKMIGKYHEQTGRTPRGARVHEAGRYDLFTVKLEKA